MAISSARAEGRARARPLGVPGNGTTAARVGARLRERGGTPRASPRSIGLLRRNSELGQLERPEEDDLVLELDAVALARPAPGLRHQGDRVLGARAVGVLDEVRVPGRDLGPADAVAAEAARLEHPPRAQLVIWVLEHAPERALVRRLRRLAPRLEIGHDRLDLGRITR